MDQHGCCHYSVGDVNIIMSGNYVAGFQNDLGIF